MPTKRRIIAVGLVWNSRGELLLCKMPEDRGVFPGQWGLPGGGIEAGETITEGLRRELQEEIGIDVSDIEPAFFKDGMFQKTFADGRKAEIYMIFLIYHCQADSVEIVLNEEFSEYRWVTKSATEKLAMNSETIDTIERIGDWPTVHRT